MAVIGQWRDFKFEISPSVMLSFNDLQIKATRDTDTVDNSGQQYIKTKIIKPFEISLTLHLCAGLGYDVQAKAEAFRGAPLYGDGRADYFYVGGKKLVPCKLSVTEATISSVEINAAGTWTAADVALTFKQAALIDGTQATTTSASTSTGSGGGGGGGGNYSKQTVTPTKTTTAKTVASALPANTKAAVTTAVTAISKITTAAKAVSTATKVVSAVKTVASKITSLFKK